MKLMKMTLAIVKLYFCVLALKLYDISYLLSIVDDKTYDAFIIKLERAVIRCWRQCAELKVGLTDDEAKRLIAKADDLEIKTDAFEYWRS